MGPAGVSRDVVAKLDGGVRAVLQANDVAERLKGLGYESFYMGPDQLAAYLKSGLAKWGKVVRAAGIRAE